MKQKVTLICIRFGRVKDGMPPLGALSLAAGLQKYGYGWEIVDTHHNYCIDHFDVSTLTQIIRQSDTPILGFSVFNDAVPLLATTLSQLGPELKDRRIFIGGPGVGGMGVELSRKLPMVESVVVGEGETVFPSILGYPQQMQRFPGVYTAHRGGNGHTAREDLNSLAPIPWKWCQGRAYNILPLSTMRGCPFGCTFCSIAAFMGRRVRMRNIYDVVADLRQGIDILGYKTVSILDDTFTMNKQRVKAFCRILVDSGMDVRFTIYSRIDTLDIELMETLAMAGCHRIFLGIDGGNDDVLSRISKRFGVSQARETVERAAQFFNVTASFIWGYPFESLNALKRMLEFANDLWHLSENFKVSPQIHLLSPSAGTILYGKYSDNLILDLDAYPLLFGRYASEGNIVKKKGRVLETIRENPRIGAPFHRYDTPFFEEKVFLVSQFNDALDRSLGRAVLEEMEKYYETQNEPQ